VRVLVDTSVWVDFLNGFPSREAKTLRALAIDVGVIATCGVVAAEVLQGLRSDGAMARAKAYFDDLDWLVPHEPETYYNAAALYRALRRNGITVRSTIDCLIAELGAEGGCQLLARDRDITRIIESGLVDVTAMPLVE
jgi:predicted nucleic acid-binding protein